MKRAVLAVLAAATLACTTTDALAAEWTKVGSSTFTAPLGTENGDVGGMGDYYRIIFNSVVVDPAGNIFATANGQTTGGLTIFKADGSKVEVNPATAGYGGPITKLVVGGDGNVYGLQNWLEIQWPGPIPVGGPYVPSRILKLTAAGGVSLIKEYSPVTYITGPPIAWTNRIVGMTVSRVSDGGDGNIYWTLGGYDNYTKYHYLWRYNIGTGLVEEAPINNHNNGHLENHRMFDLEWVGVDPDDSENQLFAVVNSVAGSEQAWRMDPMGWKITNRPEFPKENGLSDPNYPCRNHITATAYDNTWKKLIVCGRSVYSPAAGTNMFTQWANTADRPAFFEKDDTGEDPYGDTNWFWINRWPAVAHANGNNTTTPNNGAFWVSALAINPDQGRVWMAYTGDSTYDYEPRGTILTWVLGELHYHDIVNEGIPEADSYTVGLTFTSSGGAVYALVCSKSTGVYSVYKTAPMSIGKMKLAQPQSYVVTDTKKVVTYSDFVEGFFYIEEDNRESGIKVLPGESLVIPIPGERASVRGSVGTLNGEAVIYASRIDEEWATEVVDPLCLEVGKVGGQQLGLQPDTYARDPRRAPDTSLPQTLNTTGLVVRVVGKVFGSVPYTGFYLDDGSDYGIWVDYDYEAVDDDSIVGITGVSTVTWDDVNQIGVRAIQALPAPELTVYQAAP